MSRNSVLAHPSALVTVGLGLSLLSAIEVQAAVDAAPATNDAVGQEVTDEVFVLGRRERRTEIADNLVQFGNQVQVISSETIAASGVTNFAELASGFIRGANVGYSEDESEFTIRLDGGGDRDTLVTLDGVPLYDRGPGVEEIWGATLIDPHMIESVEVFRGGQSLYFGSNAGIGLVSIITKRPTPEAKGEMGVSFGSFDTRELWGNYSFPLDSEGRHSVLLYGSTNASDAPKLFRDQDMPDNHRAAGGIEDYSYSRDSYGAKYLWQIDESSELLANLQFVQTDFQDTFPNTTIYGPTTVKMPLANLAYNKTWSDKAHTAITASYRRPQLWNVKFVPEVCRVPTGCVNPSNPSNVIDWGSWTGNLLPQASRGIGNRSIMGSFEELVVSALNTFNFTPSIAAVIGLQSTNYRDRSDPEILIDDDLVSDNALILDLHLTPWFSPMTNISIAGRVDHESSFGTKSVGKYSFRQDLPAGMYARLNGGTSFSLPKTNELYASDELLVGNPDLKPEKTETMNYGMGIERHLGGGSKFSLEVGGFSTEITDRIETTSGLTPNTRYNNPRLAKIRGVVADLQYQFNPNWSLTMSYTGQDAHYEGRSFQIDAIPEWMAIGTLNFHSDDSRFHLMLNSRVQGPVYLQAPTVGGRSVEGLSQFNYGNWFVLNATAQYWMGENLQHRFALRMVNLTDEKYGNRASWGNKLYDSSAIRGEITTADADYYYPYKFYAKPRSAFLSYTYQF